MLGVSLDRHGIGESGKHALPRQMIETINGGCTAYLRYCHAAGRRIGNSVNDDILQNFRRLNSLRRLISGNGRH
jgi:hypothetical protein